TREGSRTDSVLWEFHDARVVSIRNVGRSDLGEGGGSAKHRSSFDQQELESFSIVYKSVSHQVRSPLPGSSKSDSWSAAGAESSAGATALAMHMLRMHQIS